MNFIPAKFYYDIYLVILLILSIYHFSKYIYRMESRLSSIGHTQRITGFIILLFFTLFIGLRPISAVFVDMAQYWGIYMRWNDTFIFDWHNDNLIYGNLVYYLASIKFEPVRFYLLIASIYFGCYYLACLKMFPQNHIVAFLVFLGAFSTFSYGTNGIKAGAAAAIFTLALAYRENWKICFPLLAISLGFHHSMLVPLGAVAVTYFYRNKKFYMWFWICCVLMSAAHITIFQEFFAGYADEKGVGYLTAEEGNAHVYLTGFRLDFILYSAMPVLMGWYTLKRMRYKSIMYDTLLCVYLLTNGIWMLCMYASFTNRIAYLSWCIYPFVLIYPLLNENLGGNQYKLFAKVAFLHLGFTLAMHFIYYA